MSGLKFEISRWGLTSCFWRVFGEIYFFEGDFVAILGPIAAGLERRRRLCEGVCGWFSRGGLQINDVTASRCTGSRRRT
jgi:hypothetical protein